MFRNASIFAAVVVAAGALAGPAAAQNAVPGYVTAAVNDPGRPAKDKARDADRKPAASVAFAMVKPGDKVLELFAGGGYFTRILSKVVGPTGHVYSTIPAGLLKMRAMAGDGLKMIAANPEYSNVTALTESTDAATAPVPVDVVWTSLNYHDLHNPGPFHAASMDAFNKSVYDALKPGGIYLIIDHAGAPGTGTSQTHTLHRIDPAAVKAEVTKVGFVLDGQSDALMKPNDDYTKHSSDKDSMLMLRFRKPQ